MPLAHRVEPRLLLGGRVAWGLRHQVSVLVFDIDPWTVALADQLFDETGAVAYPAVHNIVEMRGAQPSAAVRRRMAERQAAMEAAHQVPRGRTAVLTDSKLMQGAVTAWRWLTDTEVLACDPRDVARAAAFVAPGHADELAALYRGCAALLASPADRIA